MTMAPLTDRRVDDRPIGGDVVTLPPIGTGARRRRRAAQQQRERRRLAGAAAGAVMAVVVIAGLGGLGWREVRDLRVDPEAPGGGVAGDGTGGPGGAGAEGPVEAMLVVEGAGGQVVGVTVLGVDRSGAGGDVLLIPAGTMVEVPSFGLDPLREAAADGGLPLLQQSVENLLGLQLERVGTADATTLAALVEPAGVLSVEVPADVERRAPNGRVELVFREGRVAVRPGEVAALLTEPGEGSDLARLVRHQAFWTAWLAAVAEDDAARPGTDLAGGVGEVVAALAAGEVRYHLLPVESLRSGLAADRDLYRVRAAEVAELVREVFPSGAGDRAERISVQLLNGTGEPGLAQRVQPLLVPAGAEVTLTGNAARFDHEVTQVVFYADEHLDAARAVRDALGVGEVVRSRSGLDVVDVTVVVGADLMARDEAEPASRDRGV